MSSQNGHNKEIRVKNREQQEVFINNVFTWLLMTYTCEKVTSVKNVSILIIHPTDTKLSDTSKLLSLIESSRLRFDTNKRKIELVHSHEVDVLNFLFHVSTWTLTRSSSGILWSTGLSSVIRPWVQDTMGPKVERVEGD